MADFAPYLKGCTHFSAAIPNTMATSCGLLCERLRFRHTQSVLQADIYEAGYWIMLAALAPGSHTIHTRAQAPTDPMYEVTYNLTVADTAHLENPTV